MRRLFPLPILLALATPAQSAPEEGRAIEIELSAHRIAPDGEEPRRYGKLRLLGAWRLSADSSAFGGFSGLLVSTDGSELLAVGDTGYWLRADLSHRADGTLEKISGARIGPLKDSGGMDLAARGSAWRDAESLARLADGGLLVGFERQHRLWRYRTLSALPRPFPAPGGLPPGGNRGLEGLVRLPDGRLAAFSEGLRTEDGNWRAWLHQEGQWREMRYARSGGLAPVGAALLPGGDILVLERFFSILGGLSVRLMRVRLETLSPGALLEPEELARWSEPPFDIDNFEAVAARAGPAGRALIYLLADDNFNAPAQQTLLFQFMLWDAPAP